MGVILSCCREREDEDEPLLSQQQGYGTENRDLDEQSEVQRQKREEEMRVLAREQQLRDIVSDTNDKLIDISMINNSGIVAHGRDISDANGATNGTTTKEGANGVEESNEDVSAEPVSAESHVSEPCTVLTKSDSKYSLKELKAAHKLLFDQLQTELEVKPTGDLVVSL
ncbi:Protein MEH1 [Nakaseomyces bracarensis]|uniref:Protein MEH1 n=1 Tax=Nakaseomyces bracarensis TaxID=273131 RepID=A0ABR4NMD1_9SACH